MRHPWTDAEAIAAASVLGRYPRADLAAALAELTRALGRPVTLDGLAGALRRRGLPPPSALLRPDVAPAEPPPPEPAGEGGLCASAPARLCASAPARPRTHAPEPPRPRPALVWRPEREPPAPLAPGPPAAASPEPLGAAPLAPPPPAIGRQGAEASGGGVGTWRPKRLRGPRPPATPEADLDPAGRLSPDDRARVELLYARARRRALPLGYACELLDVTPAEARALVSEAAAAGWRVRLADGHVCVPGAREGHDGEWLLDLDDAPVRGRQYVILVSDLHFGSKWCLEGALASFIRYGYDKGARHVLIPGDLLDGCKDKCIPEQDHVGFDRQAARALAVLPRLPGLVIGAIGGNHDEHFSCATGFSAPRALENAFRAAGREDFYVAGECAGRVRAAGAIWHLHHPLGAGGSASSVAATLTKQINSYDSDEVPDFQLCGHFHKYVTFEHRGVVAIGCPSFQDEGSAFSQRICGRSQIGGVLVSYDVTDEGRVADVSVAFKSHSHILRRCA